MRLNEAFIIINNKIKNFKFLILKIFCKSCEIIRFFQIYLRNIYKHVTQEYFQEEMRDWIMPVGFDHADAEANHLVGMADDDKDGKLSIEEIIAHYDTFVGSQATDYGEQLQKHDPSEL